MVTPSYLKFSETQLDLGVNYGMSAQYDWGIEILKNSDSGETRNKTRSAPIGRWQLGQRQVLQEGLDALLELESFFRERNGSLEGFRFKDWIDYRGTDEPIGTGDGISTQFQLVKRYSVGSFFYDRVITKPVSGATTLKVNGVAVSGTVNTANGLVTLDIPPLLGLPITATFEFDIPVWFENDSFPMVQEAYDKSSGTTIYKIGSITVVEGRVEPAIQIPEVQPLPIPDDGNPLDFIIEQYIQSPKLDIGFFDKTTVSTVATNRIVERNGWRKTIQNSGKKYQIATPQRTIRQDFLDEILDYWWVCRGQWMDFEMIFKDETYLARFNETPSFRFAALSDSGEALYSVQGLSFLGNRFYRENFSISEDIGFGNVLSFTLTADPAANVPADADIYLYEGSWDSEGTLGTYNTGETPQNRTGFFYNARNDDGQIASPAVELSGPPILIGKGDSVDGTSVEDEAPLAPGTGFIGTLLFMF